MSMSAREHRLSNMPQDVLRGVADRLADPYNRMAFRSASTLARSAVAPHPDLFLRRLSRLLDHLQSGSELALCRDVDRASLRGTRHYSVMRYLDGYMLADEEGGYRTGSNNGSNDSAMLTGDKVKIMRFVSRAVAASGEPWCIEHDFSVSRAAQVADDRARAADAKVMSTSLRDYYDGSSGSELYIPPSWTLHMPLPPWAA